MYYFFFYKVFLSFHLLYIVPLTLLCFVLWKIPSLSQLSKCYLVAPSCLTFCNAMDCSMPGYCVHGILQARILEWIAIPFSRESFQPRDQTQVSYIAGRFFISWATREVPKLTTYQKYCHFEESSSLILLNNNESFFDWIVTCDKKWTVYYNQPWQAQWLDREETPKHFQKPNLHLKGTWSLLGGLLLIWPATAYPGETITSEKYAQQIDKMHQKLQHFHPGLANRKGRILLHNNAWPHIAQPMFQSWMNWARQFCHFCHIHLTSCQLTTTSLSILTTFCRGNTSTNSRRQEMFSENSLNPEAWIYDTWISKLSSHW